MRRHVGLDPRRRSAGILAGRRSISVAGGLRIARLTHRVVGLRIELLPGAGVAGGISAVVPRGRQAAAQALGRLPDRHRSYRPRSRCGADSVRRCVARVRASAPVAAAAAGACAERACRPPRRSEQPRSTSGCAFAWPHPAQLSLQWLSSSATTAPSLCSLRRCERTELRRRLMQEFGHVGINLLDDAHHLAAAPRCSASSTCCSRSSRCAIYSRILPLRVANHRAVRRVDQFRHRVPAAAAASPCIARGRRYRRESRSCPLRVPRRR